MPQRHMPEIDAVQFKSEKLFDQVGPFRPGLFQAQVPCQSLIIRSRERFQQLKSPATTIGPVWCCNVLISRENSHSYQPGK